MDIHLFIKEATRWRIVRRSVAISLVVGTILTGINHGGCVMSGCFSSVCAMQCGLTYMVPYCVSTISCVLALADRDHLSPNSDRDLSAKP